MSKKSKKIKKLDMSQLIKQRLRTDLGISEEQIEIIEKVLQGYMPGEDAEYITQTFSPKLLDEKEDAAPPLPPPALTIDMEDGIEQTIRLTNHPLNIMYDYLTEHYGKKFGTIYWGALTSIGKPQDFYGFLGHLKKSEQFK